MSPVNETNSFMQRLEEAEDLPVLPQVHSQAMRIAQNPESNISELKEILKYDPALTATILKISNSAYYGFSHKVESLQTALVMLGLREVTNLIVTAAIVHTFPTDEMSKNFDAEKFWLHTVSTGILSGFLVHYLKLATNGDVFTGGLLHDLGRVLLASHFPEEFDKCIAYSREKKVAPRIAERYVLGIDHSAIGGYLATRWELPESLTAMIRYHHAPNRENYHMLDVAVVHLANRLSKHHGFRVLDYDDEEETESLEQDSAWNTICGQLWPDNIDLEKLFDKAKEEADSAGELVRALLTR